MGVCPVWAYVHKSSGARGGQKLELQVGGYETITLLGGLGCWEPNLGPLQEQNSILTSDPSLQTLILIKNKNKKTLKPRLVLNLQQSLCFSLPNAGIIGMG